ncbi:MAG TPA: DUF3616 domain-containing protein [Blastocatellia bacterium]|nr:DUF3616 domain-containing protein [Blastocatellia bacterium]
MSYRMKMIFPVAGMLFLFGYVGSALHSLAPSAPIKAFTGGSFEASGVVHVPGTTSVLFVDDGRPNEVLWMQLDENGHQSGAVKAIGLGLSVIDLEGITGDGTHFYVVGSQSKASGSDRAGLVRFKFDARSQRVEAVELIWGLKKFLAENVEELRGMADRSYRDGGINVEGLAWDPQGGRWLLGLRSPVVDGQALLVPLRLRAPGAAFSVDNLEVIGNKAIQLSLGGAGVRSIEYDPRANTFQLLTGAARNGEKTDFKLWRWNGDSGRPVLNVTNTFDRKLKPEGVTRIASGSRNFTFIVFDTSGYTALE